MNRLILTGFVAASLAAGCQNKEAAGPSPEALSKLVECQQELARSKTAADMCTKQLDQVATAAPQGEDGWVIKIEGGSWTLTNTPKAPTAPDLSPDQWAKLMGAIEKQMKLSRGGMQQCYVSALKKNTSLQAAVITLQVRVSIGDGGHVTRSSFAPNISSDFNSCMGAITKKWTVPDAYAGQTIEVPIQLQPTS